jgi:hypothetical protein
VRAFRKANGAVQPGAERIGCNRLFGGEAADTLLNVRG